MRKRGNTSAITSVKHNQQFKNKIPYRITEAESILSIIDEQHPITLGLTAPFGSGKTVLIHLMLEKIRKDNINHNKKIGHIVFNAWKYDYWNDPLLAFMDAISPTALTNENLYLLHNFSQKIKRSYKKLLTSWKRLWHFSYGILGETSKQAITSLLVAHGIDPISAGAGSSVVEKLLTAFPEKRLSTPHINHDLASSIKDFRKNLARYLKSANFDRFYIFIDELDRCRPNFAIAFLELVKHIIFNQEELNTKPASTEEVLNDVSYIFSIDKNQLIEIIKHTYGQGFDAHGYLRRFFTFCYNITSDCSKNEYLDGLLENDLFNSILPLKATLYKVVDDAELEPRNIEKLLYYLNTAIAFEKKLFKFQYDDNYGVHNNLSITWGEVYYVYLLFLAIKLKSPETFSGLLKVINEAEALEYGMSKNNIHANISNILNSYPKVKVKLLFKFFIGYTNLSNITAFSNLFSAPKAVFSTQNIAAAFIADSINKLGLI